MELRPQNAKGAEPTEKTSLITALMIGLLFVGWVGESPVEIDSVMYLGKWRSFLVILGPLFTPVPGISLFPWQILLFALVPFCLGSSDAKRRHSPEMDRAMFVSIACVGLTFLWGLLRGGSAYFAYYQVWRFLAALLIAYMLMSLVRSERDFLSLGKVVVLAALIRAILCIYYYWNYLYGKPFPTYVTDHDDSMLWVVATLVTVIWALLKGGRTPWAIVLLVVPFLLYAIVLNDRRIAWVELALSMPLLYMLIGPGPLRSQINKWAVRAAPVLILYLVAGLGSSSGIFAPVHAMLTTGSDYDPSSLTRQEEARNLLHTLVDFGNPLLGTGWGVPYDKAETYWSNYDSGWVLTLYTPHNAILGLATFTGLVGMIGIWGVVPVGAYVAARGCLGSSRPVPRTAAMVALSSLTAYSVHCYGDIGFQSFVGCLIFGAALGTAGKVAAWSEVLPAARTATMPIVGGRTVPGPRSGKTASPRQLPRKPPRLSPRRRSH
jgi:hypothetical protein